MSDRRCCINRACGRNSIDGHNFRRYERIADERGPPHTVDDADANGDLGRLQSVRIA
ncbi:MAG: hypothetical protein VB140_00370 [Burkholderia sp.]